MFFVGRYNQYKIFIDTSDIDHSLFEDTNTLENPLFEYTNNRVHSMFEDTKKDKVLLGYCGVWPPKY